MRVFREGMRTSTATLVLLALTVSLSTLASAAGYKATNLVADQSGVAPHTDPNLINAWGISYSPTGPFWVTDNNTGVSTLYNTNGVPQPLIVTIPLPPGMTGTSTPNGTVFNGSIDFVVTNGTASGPASFLFVTEEGTISGWSATVDMTNAILAVDNSAQGINYKGMEIAKNGTANFLYVANFFDATVDVYDTNFNKVTLSGSFTDTNLPPGFAPFNIRKIGTRLFVSYAKQNATKSDAVLGAGLGVVDVYDLNGKFIKRFTTMGQLNAPWGLALAPSNFGTFSSAVLVGNLGDGRITAFNASTGASLGQLSSPTGQPISINGLWGITFGNGGMGGMKNVLYYAAGPNGYKHGRFGNIKAQP